MGHLKLKENIKGIIFQSIIILLSFFQNVKGQITIKDNDGNVYSLITIGNQIWTVENLKTTTYNDGTPIPCLKDKTSWVNDSTGGYCYYDNDTSKIQQLGLMYNWHAINTGKLSIMDYHVPTIDDWNILRDYLIANGYNYDKSTTGNKVAKSIASKELWNDKICYGGNGSACTNKQYNNLTGFTGIPAGFRNYNAYYLSYGENCEWWSATEYNETMAYFIQLIYYSEKLESYMYDKKVGRSVRLVKYKTE
ncbi:MAG: FISUMP domain-containing protein [Cyclobacteriaceae bacterium]